MRAVFMGTPEFAVPVLEALDSCAEADVVAVYTPPDRPKGRGQGIDATPVKLAALEMGLEVLQPTSLRSSSVQKELSEFRPDVVVVAAYGKLLPPAVLELPPHGCLNIHPSLLPRYRGPSPVVTTILDGLEETGVTLMLLDEGMDTGPILAQREVPLNGTETAQTLTEDLFAAGARLLVENLSPWASGLLEAEPQNDMEATVTAKLERADGKADWSLPAVTLERMQRAYTPWPGLFTQWQGKALRLLEVASLECPQPSEGGHAPSPGEVVSLDLSDISAGVGTAWGILGIKRLQLEGRRASPSAEFLRGYPDFVGSRL